MSNKGIYTALSGAMAQSQRLDTIANNIANSSTTAFKRDNQVFKEYLSSHEKNPTVLEVPRVPASVEHFYDMNGGDKSYVETVGTFTDFSQGPVKPTGNNLDFAIEGNGFFEILTPQGVRLSRNGSFKVDKDSRLVNGDGFPVLMAQTNLGQPAEGQAATDSDPLNRVIRLTSSKVNVTPTGEIYVDGERIQKLSLVEVQPKEATLKVGASMYKLNEAMKDALGEKPKIISSKKAEILQGHLESSNVNIVREMTDMIQTQRTFESTQRLIKAYDELQQRLVNTVPKME